MNSTKTTNDENRANKRRVSKMELLATFAFFVANWIFWGVRYDDFLFVSQENSLFLFRWDFFLDWIGTPGGFLGYLTAFFLQFSYFPLLGGAIWAFWGTALHWTTAKTLNLRGVGYVFSFLPSCCLIVSATWVGYEVYIPFNASLIYNGFVGATLATAAFAGFRSIKSCRARLLFALGVGSFAYPGFGFWAAFFLFICGLDEATTRWASDAQFSEEQISKKRILSAPTRRAIALTASAAIIPLAWYYFKYFSCIKFCNFWIQGLIDDVRDKPYVVSAFSYGFASLAAFFYATTLVFSKILGNRAAKNAGRGKKSKRDREKTANARILNDKTFEKTSKKSNVKASEKGADVDEAETARRLERAAAKSRTRLFWELTAVVWAATFAISYRPATFFSVLASTRALADGDWERVLESESRLTQPNVQNVALRNLALFETGALAEKAFERPISGLSTSRISEIDLNRAQAGSSYYRCKFWLDALALESESSSRRASIETIFCYYGRSNIAARIATDNFVATEGRSASCLKTLAICATINGEKNLARRYLNVLAETLFYRNWANERLAFLETEDFRRGIRDSLDDAEYAARLKEREDAAPTRESIENAARRFGVDSENLRKIAKKVEKARSLRPLKDAPTPKGYPNLTFFLNLFVDDFDDATPEVRELELVGALLQKNGDFFLKHVDKYLEERGFAKGGAPKAIEEGLATWRFSAFGDDWDKIEYQFRPETVAGLTAFTNFVNSVQNSNSPSAQAQIREYYAGTYWGFGADQSIYEYQN